MDIPNLEPYLPATCRAVPPLGEDIESLARLQQQPYERILEHLLFRRDCPPVTLTVSPGVKRNFTWLPGHGYLDEEPERYGPRKRYRAAIVGLCLGTSEEYQRRLYVGSSGRLLRELLDQAGLRSYSELYLTSLLKTRPLSKAKPSAGQLSRQAAILTIELLLTRPRYVLALGVEAAKFFFKKKAFTLQSGEGRWFPFRWDLRSPENSEAVGLLDEGQLAIQPGEEYYDFMVMPCINPAALEYEQKPEILERVTRVVSGFVRTLETNQPTVMLKATGDQPPSTAEQFFTLSNVEVSGYPVLRSIPELRQVADRWAAESTYGLVAIDAEWQGEHPQNAGSYLRCVQFGWRAGQAAVLSLTDTEGRFAFADEFGNKTEGARQQAFDIIAQTFERNRLRVAGFYFGADYEWLTYHGLDMMPYYRPAETPERARLEGGFALELAVAAVDELAKINLENVRWRFTDVGDYFGPFDAYKKEVEALAKKGAGRKADKAAREQAKLIRRSGYGWIPDEHLYPYAGGDADATIQGVFSLMKLLDADQFGNNCWLPYWRALRASPVVCEIMRTGMPFSKRRCAELSFAYGKVFKAYERKVRYALNWPTLNVNSSPQMTVALYGARYSPKRDTATGRTIDLRTRGARSLNLEPVISNDKRPVVWSKIRAAGTEAENKPGTDAKAMAMMRKSPTGVEVRRKNQEGEFEVIQIPSPALLDDLFYSKSIGHIRKNYVGVPTVSRDPAGQLSIKFKGGYGARCCDDGYLRSFVSQTKETGRWSTARPTMNPPKRKENNYKQATGADYPGKLRTMIEAPEGFVIVAADYKSAELFMLAIASRDDVLWDHCQRNLLDETDPNFIDPHARLLVNGFKLACEPTKTGLDSIGMGHVREVAKCVAVGEYLATDRGLVRVENVAPGLQPEQATDELIIGSLQSDLGTTPLLGALNVGELECIRVESHLGYEVTTSQDHRHYVLTREGVIDFKPADQLGVGDYLLLSLDAYFNPDSGDLPARLQEVLDYLVTDRVFTSNGITAEAAGLLGILASATVLVDTKRDAMLITLGNSVTEKSRDSVVDLFRYLLDDQEAATGALGSDNQLMVRSKAMLAVYGGLSACGWSSVPDLILLWPEALRETYCRCVAIGKLGGVRQGQHVLLPVEDARRYQMALQTLGWLTHRTGCADSNRQRVGIYDGASAAFFEFARLVGAEPNGFCEERSDVGAVKFPVTLSWLADVAERCNIPVSIPDGSIPWSNAKALVRSVAGQLDKRRSQLTAAEQEYLQRLLDCFEACLIPLPVLKVESVGRRVCYDFETTATRRHLMFVNGVASHNSVIYGFCYGRMAAAIQLGAREEGIEVTLEETQRLIDALAAEYSQGASYLEDAAARVYSGYLVTPMGRIRRCPKSVDKKKLNDYGREFKNAPIQGGVADVVNEAGYNLQRERALRRLTFRIMMQIHDAYMFLCPYPEVYELCNEVIPKAMSEDIPIVPFGLDGTRLSGQPRRMGCGVELCFRWGETAKAEQLLAVGIDPKLIKGLE